MSEILLEYHPVNPTTWAYLSSLLMIGLFFKFGRFWSVRNLDLGLLILFAPGLLLVLYGRDQQRDAATLAASLSQAAAAEAPASGVETEEGVEEGAEEAPAGSIDEPGTTAAASPQETNDDGANQASAADRPPEAGDDRLLKDVVGAAPEDDAPAWPAAAEAQLQQGRSLEVLGFHWLLTVCGLFLVRLLLDATMVRRPLLEPNLSTGGLIFIGCWLFVFLMANVINSRPTAADLAGPKSAEILLSGGASGEEAGDPDEALRRHGPGNALLHFVPSLPTMPLLWSERKESKEIAYVRTAKTMAILSHLAVVIGIVGIGYRHFDNVQMGIGAAALYLMLPYTAQMTGRVDHVLPAALLIWAVLSYRHPLPAGMFIGLAIGVVYYPLFLVPLWLSFYWQRGLMRFSAGVVSMLIVMACSLIFISHGFVDFLSKLQDMLGLWRPMMEGLQGVWGLGWDPVYRIPVLTVFLILCVTLAIWPPQKNLGTLLSCSAAVMVATQFWHGFGGGLYMAWYLPLILLTIFRPNLEDRVALSVLGEGWFPRRRTAAGSVERAA